MDLTDIQNMYQSGGVSQEETTKMAEEKLKNLQNISVQGGKSPSKLVRSHHSNISIDA